MLISKITRIVRYVIKQTEIYLNNKAHQIFNQSADKKRRYVDWLLNKHKEIPNYYIPICEDNIKIKATDTKLIAFYLPQYYETEYNNKYFGKGFMEWYNVTKTIPQYTGHYQPQLPIDVGFYDLTHDDIMYRQIELAKKYGIYGFCFYYYWFSGERLLDKPLDNFLANKNLNMPFCLFWANETWTNIWGEGNERQIIKEQKLNDDDDDKFVNDILKYFRDERYIKINGKPLLIIYRAKIFEYERFQKFIKNLREKIKTAGYDGIQILLTDSDIGSIVNMQDYDTDGLVEFTHRDITKNAPNLNLAGKFVNPNFKGVIYDIEKALKSGCHLLEHDYNVYKSLVSGWDNTPRKAYSGAMVFHMKPNDYKKWLIDIINWTKKNKSKEEQFVFIDSWNEWAEGAHLEPDQHYGYAYLQATREALEETAKD